MAIKKGDQILDKFKGDNPPVDFEFPSIGIEDIDRAVFKLFDEKLSFQTTQNKESKKVPVVFAAGERFALTRRKNPIRDKNNALILPLISIMRSDIDFSPDQKGKKTSIAFRNQNGYVVKRRISERDRNYQNVINKLGLANQKSASSRRAFELNDISPGNVAKPGEQASRRNGKNLSFSSQAGAINLESQLGNNIFEIIEIPYPEFIAVSYEVTFWTQYIQQANEMIETLIYNFDGQGEEIMTITENGYELVVFFDKSFTNNSNVDNYSDDERVIKNSINLTVPGYILNPKHPGIPNLARSYYSAPLIDFGYQESRSRIVENNQPVRGEEQFKKNVLQDLTNVEEADRRGDLKPVIEENIVNPFTGKNEIEFSKIRYRNQRTGETVGSGLLITDIERQND